MIDHFMSIYEILTLVSKVMPGTYLHILIFFFIIGALVGIFVLNLDFGLFLIFIPFSNDLFNDLLRFLDLYLLTSIF